jgi:hypothetical protein
MIGRGPREGLRANAYKAVVWEPAGDTEKLEIQAEGAWLADIRRRSGQLI